ncbi:His-Xaa-Ser system radical SAM maturase HxsC [Cobetia crustatorum]|uniref:His-Xaa-Ser system radical SAM maturase HxsC n=1 Tax=Cobetia crustatorum TaxID=553385 RepID=UPI0004B1D856|nr:His-Xaa-Ser system radical SAM maturase HxsC [Cobetia crustatorum]
MIKLYSKECRFYNWEESPEPIILSVTENPHLPRVLAKKYAIVLDNVNDYPEDILSGYAAILSRQSIQDVRLSKFISLDPEFSYIKNGDVIRINAYANEIRVLFRVDSDHNSLLVTERCNSFCLMCSQPPRNVDDSYLIKDACDAIKCMPRSATSLGITGGEPTLLDDGFLEIVQAASSYLPETYLHILTNGRSFSDRANSRALKRIKHPNLMLGIPLYSDLSEQHDFIVQAKNAFEETIKGILNLRRDGVRVELRVVIHKQTYSRLPDLARFIARNLAFVEHVAFMGLELTGFTKANFKALWIDPHDYRNELDQACRILQASRVKTMIYNHQLCLLSEYSREFSVNSISDWKNEYLEKCTPCMRKNECGGFFSTGFSLTKTSDFIKPFMELEKMIPVKEIC